jgi:hypothetical protein
MFLCRCQLYGDDLTNTATLIPELYEPDFGVKKFGGSDNFQSFLGCFSSNLQIHIKAKNGIHYISS